MITKINTLTGETETYYRGGKKAKEIYEDILRGKGIIIKIKGGI